MTKLAKDKILATLKERILAGELESDTPLKEKALAEQFGVSRTPVREALRQLVNEQLVRIVPNLGAFVGSMSWKDATEVFTIRKVLEAYAAQLTVRRLDSSVIRQLEEILDESRLAIGEGDVNGYVKCDERFHAILNENCGNTQLTKLIQNLNDRTKLTKLRLTAFDSKTGLETSFREHRAILEKLKAKDPHGVGQLVWQHGQRFYAQVTSTDVPSLFS